MQWLKVVQIKAVSEGSEVFTNGNLVAPVEIGLIECDGCGKEIEYNPFQLCKSCGEENNAYLDCEITEEEYLAEQVKFFPEHWREQLKLRVQFMLREAYRAGYNSGKTFRSNCD